MEKKSENNATRNIGSMKNKRAIKSKSFKLLSNLGGEFWRNKPQRMSMNKVLKQTCLRTHSSWIRLFLPGCSQAEPGLLHRMVAKIRQYNPIHTMKRIRSPCKHKSGFTTTLSSKFRINGKLTSEFRINREPVNPNQDYQKGRN